MAKYFHHFLPLSQNITDETRKDMQCLQEIPFIINNAYTLTIRLLGRPHTIDVIGITIPDSLPVDQRDKWIQQIGNHMVATLRLTYTNTADVIRTADGFIQIWMETDQAFQAFCTTIEPHHNNNHLIDIKNVTTFFCGTFNGDDAVIVHLLAEAHTPTIPTHYKILSLIRALEILFPNDKERSAWLEQYQEQFSAIKISEKPFRNALPELRTRCAHGVSRGQVKPFVSQAYVELPGLTELLNLLKTVISDRLKEKYNWGPKSIV